MRFVLLAGMAALAACVDEPPGVAERAQMECAKGGIAPGSPGYPDCYSRIYSSLNAGQEQRNAARRAQALSLSQAPMIQPIQVQPIQAQQPYRRPVTCQQFGVQVQCW